MSSCEAAHASNCTDPPPGISSSLAFLSPDICLFSSLIFFVLTARVIPLRSGLRVFCFVGSALNNTGFPPTKQTLACDSTPPRSLSCPKEKGAERKGKNKMSYLNVKWNSSALAADARMIRARLLFDLPLPLA